MKLKGLLWTEMQGMFVETDGWQKEWKRMDFFLVGAGHSHWRKS